MAPAITRYLALKRALGRRYAVERDVLRHPDTFMAATGSDFSPTLFTAWSQTLDHLTSGVRRNRMRIVRNLCLYRRRTEEACLVRDLSQFPSPHQSVRPYIFTEDDIVRLLDVADHLQPTPGAPLRRETYRLAIALLYTTGLRRGELLHLVLGDYDVQERTLLVRASKFHKSRLLPLSPDAAREIHDVLAARRAKGLGLARDSPLLCRQDGRAYSHGGFAQGLRRLIREANVQAPSGAAPRVHDLRHMFAVHDLLRWYRSGADVQAKLPLLATYMGHVSIVSTQYYLQFIDEIAAAASTRFAKRYAALASLSPVSGRGES